jgi:hypothetical protein
MVDHLLRKSADFLTEECNPHGCMIVRSALSCSEAEEAIKRELTARRTLGETRLRERLKRAKKEGEVPPELDPADYARFIMTMLEGMSVRAAAGATRKGAAQDCRYGAAHLAGLSRLPFSQFMHGLKHGRFAVG